MTQSPRETEALALRIAPHLKPGDVLLLKGDLGAGKSLFARALIKSFCGEETEVPSPTFTLVQTYDAPKFTIWHFDLYRIDVPEDVHELGIEEALATGVCLIEWPEKLGEYLPKGAFEIEFTYGDQESERSICFKNWGDRLS